MENPNDDPTHAALIVQCGAALNSLNSSLFKLKTFKPADKKLQVSWAELGKLATNVYSRLIGRLDGPTGDYINSVSNQSEQLTLCLCYLPADQRRKLISMAEDMARPFQVVEEKHLKTSTAS